VKKQGEEGKKANGFFMGVKKSTNGVKNLPSITWYIFFTLSSPFLHPTSSPSITWYFFFTLSSP